MALSPSQVLIIVALADEAKDVFTGTGVRLQVCGVGKVNAAYATAVAVREARPSLVLNVGTAGSPTFPQHALVECTRFVQRDMDISPLGFPRGTTPFDELPAVLEAPRRLLELPEGVCGTGDSFETTLGPSPDGLGLPVVHPESGVPVPTVIEMEAYAVAKVCRKEGLPFACVKYITDGSDGNASSDWAANLPRAARRFREAFDRLLG